MPSPAEQLNEMAARLKAFGVIMRLGHDLFAAPDFNTAATMAVNNARPVVGFRSSSLLRLQDRKAEILSQYAQVEPNHNSRQSLLYRDLLELAGELQDTVEISAANASDYGDGSVVGELCPDNTTILLVPLKAPSFLNTPSFQLVWLLEFDTKPPAYSVTSAKLLSSSYAEALYCQRLGGSRLKAFGRRRRLNLTLLFWLVVLAGLVYVMFQPINEKVNAEFELKAPQITAVYAWFDGPIAECYRRNGEYVRQGDVIAEYDTSQLLHRLAAAEAAKREIEAELELKEKSFADKNSLGEVPLLKARLASAEVTIKEAQWYLDHSKLAAPRDGMLQLTDQRPEALRGKAVRTGDKIFDVLGGDGGMDVKIPVLESESSILLNLHEGDNLTLFLHTSPDTPITAKVREISPAPELTEQRTYCYTITAELPEETAKNLKYGMRGIAKVEGEQVSIGYFLFKSVILYLRGL